MLVTEYNARNQQISQPCVTDSIAFFKCPDRRHFYSDHFNNLVCTGSQNRKIFIVIGFYNRDLLESKYKGPFFIN